MPDLTSGTLIWAGVSAAGKRVELVLTDRWSSYEQWLEKFNDIWYGVPNRAPVPRPSLSGRPAGPSDERTDDYPAQRLTSR